MHTRDFGQGNFPALFRAIFIQFTEYTNRTTRAKEGQNDLFPKASHRFGEWISYCASILLSFPQSTGRLPPCCPQSVAWGKRIFTIFYQTAMALLLFLQRVTKVVEALSKMSAWRVYFSSYDFQSFEKILRRNSPSLSKVVLLKAQRLWHKTSNIVWGRGISCAENAV